MTHRLLTLLIGLCTLSAMGQIAYWAIPPTFDEVEILPNGLIATSISNKWGLHDARAKKLLTIEHDPFTEFSEDMALVYKDGVFTGIVDVKGRLINLHNADFEPIKNNKFFSHGYLNVAKAGRNYYIDKRGEIVGGPYKVCFPFFDGYALAQISYVDKNKEETYWTLLNQELQEVDIPFFNKKKQVDFLSSFRDGRAVGVFKEKAYFVNDSLAVTPIYNDDSDPKKVQIKDIVSIDEKPDRMVVTFKNGTMTFNGLRQLEKIEFKGKASYTYKEPAKKPLNIKTKCDITEEEDLYGLTYDDEPLLPAQFSEMKKLPGDFVLAQFNDKWGIIKIDPDNQFQFKLNNNENIGFNHRFHTTKLATFLPTNISSKSATILSKSPDCEILIESRNEKESVECNILSYDCKLTIPENLTDTLSTHDYTYVLKYDGLRSKDYTISIPEWFVKSYEIVLSDAQYVPNQNDSIIVHFDLVRKGATKNEDSKYFKAVDLLSADNEFIPLTKITENHYSFKAGAGNSQHLSFKVKITENGCPSIFYPIEMEIEKPSPKSKKNAGNASIISAVRGASMSSDQSDEQSTE